MHVVVTGASSGIGEAIAREYLARGAKVTLVARRKGHLEKIATAGADRSHVVSADLSDPDAAWAWLDDAERALGPIDVLVNNAGVQIVKRVVDTDWAEAERMMRLDLLVPLRLTTLVLRRMIPRRSGAIVDIASLAALAPTPGMFFYNAAKAGLAAASEGLRAEVKPHGIHVVTVYPGPVTSELEAAARAAYEDRVTARNVPTGSPEVLARMIADAVAKKRPRVVYPRLYGATRHFPNATRWALDALTPPLKS
ncbi:MAG: SDR family NAD(P)-dependent oxidoreductase [Labilithrix sp.]|nr:SDR family NAD(P)-dependent oxidoreductase [Labilithrix sp.]MCW5817676.1 SDR family NAD(P)-dependent oxidoreductase [Labilithrix sp.]